MKVSSKNVVFAMSSENEAVASCNPGDEITFETMDCFSNQILAESDKIDSINFDRVNPATGPVKVKGARIGDILKVEIKKIKIDDKGVMVAVPQMGILDKFIKEAETKVISIESGLAVFNKNIKIPINPMIGVIGVSPKSGSIACGIPGSHGGNMDTKVIVEGNTIYFPVFVDGGMLSMGDLHAVMGDGEVVVCGIEIAGEVTVKIDIVKGKSITDPIVESEEYFYTIASADTLDEAGQKAADNMFIFLKERLPLSDNEITMLMSIICDLQISQVVDPQKTARMRVKKKELEKYELSF
ncbi:MAG: acetamidase/formamidase family protein [bacterium]